MKIISIRLKGFKPLMVLSKIVDISIDMRAPLTLIAGCNGSGKTNLMNEANASPASRSKYTPTGSSTIVMEHDGITYTLSSDFSKSNPHSFIQHGTVDEELNKGGTAGVQRELGLKHFRYTPIIEKVLSGKLLFTEMNVSQRKDTMMAISPLELDYALGIFQKVKIQARDVVGALKHVVEKTTTSRTNLETLGYTKEMSDLKVRLEGELETLGHFSHRNGKPVAEIIDYMSRLTARLEDVIKQWDRYPRVYLDDDSVTDEESLINYIGSLSGLITANQLQVDTLTEEYNELGSIADSVGNGDLTIDELNIKHSQIVRDIAELGCHGEDKVNDPKFMLLNLTTLSKGLSDLVATEQVTVFSRDEVNNLELKYSSVRTTIAKIKMALPNHLAREKHLLSDEDSVVCPKCTLKFSVSGGDTTSELVNVRERIKRCNLGLVEHLESEKKLLSELENVSVYHTMYSKITNLFRSVQLPMVFWDVAPSEDDIIRGSLTLYTEIGKWTSRLESQVRFNDLELELTAVNAGIELHSKYSGGATARLNKLSTNISSLLASRGILQARIGNSRLLLNTYKSLNDLVMKGNSTMRELENSFIELTDITIRDDARARTEKIYDRLATIVAVVRKRDALVESISNMDTEIESLTKNKVALKLLMDTLSPNNGVIADQMLGFINSYIHEMNRVIEQVWETQLSVGQCTMDDGVLNYKLALDVDGNMINDIGAGSTGQRDIIDLAFVLVMREYLNINDYPLYLDETGSSFDETHRTKLMAYISNLLDTGNCSQILMVNHFNSMHGGLRNHEVVVLDSRNITVPDTYNEYVKIVYED